MDRKLENAASGPKSLQKKVEGNLELRKLLREKQLELETLRLNQFQAKIQSKKTMK